MLRFENALGPRIKRLSCAMDQLRNESIAELDLTSSQAFVLGYLVHNRDRCLYPGDIAQRFGWRHPTVSGILQRLESKGFIGYAADRDRRRKRVVVTPKAIECNDAILEKLQDNERRAAAGLSDEEQTQLRSLLDRLLENINGSTTGADREQEETI